MSRFRKGKRKINSRSKGGRFERAIAKLVVANFCDYGITSEHCFRTPMSGGHRFASKQDPGDLVIHKKLVKMFPFSVECKFYKKLEVTQFWKPLKKSSIFTKWLKQTCKAAKNYKGTQTMYPMLVFKANNFNGTIMCAVPALTLLKTDRIKSKLPFTYNNEQWYVCTFTKALKILKKQREEKC